MKKELDNMDSSRRKIDQAFEQKLRERFEDFQAPDKAGLSEKIFESIGTKPRRGRWLAAFGVIFLLMLWFPAGFVQEKSRISGPKKMLSESGKIEVYRSIKNRKTLPETPLSKVADVRNVSVNASRFLPKVIAAHSIQEVNTNRFVQKTEPARAIAFIPDSSARLASVRADFNVNQMSLRNLQFRQLSLPGISFQDSLRTKEPKSRSKLSSFVPVFSVTGLQQFQLVNVHSDSEIPFQNVRFAPLLSARSTAYKVSMGLEKGSFRLLLNYGNLRNWSYYELGTKRIEIDPTNGDQYVQRRGGVPQVIDEKLHLLGLSARTALPLSRTPLRGLSTLAGLEFTTVLPDRSIMFWANISSTKSFHLGKKTGLAIGPFAEYSLTQRRLLGGRWQSRPYRIGLTAEIKFPGK